jgi:micrococcal nuclease
MTPAVLILIAEAFTAQVPATVVRVIDGDTIEVRARIWTDTVKETRVRLIGIDTPEINGKCDEERARAVAARDFLASLPRQVTLTDIKNDKFGGRIDARVRFADGTDAAELLIAAGHGRRYDGGKRGSWCGLTAK